MKENKLVLKILLFLSVLFFTACDDKEKEAKQLYTLAKQQWEKGFILDSLKKFDELFLLYPHEDITKEALDEKNRLFESYELKFISKANKSRGEISNMLHKRIEDYFSKNFQYPNYLKLLYDPNTSKFSKYFNMCSYEKAVYDLGYTLDCRYSDKSYQKDKSINVSDYITINSLSKPFDDKIPTNFFKASYYSKSYSNLISTQIVKDISINFTDTNNLAIKPNDFMGHWIGYINIEKDSIKSLSIAQSNSKTRVLVNDIELFDGKGEKVINLKLKQGLHKIEVFHSNNWHTANFVLSIVNDSKVYSSSELRKELENSLKNFEYDNYIVTIFESKNFDNSIKIDIEYNSKPIVLFLNSYHAINWKIKNVKGSKIYAIIYNSKHPGTTIQGDVKDSLLFKAEKITSSYTFDTVCSCVSGYLNCNGADFFGTNTYIKVLTNKDLSGFTTGYAVDNLIVPQVKVDKNFLLEQQKSLEKKNIQSKECMNKSNPQLKLITN